MSPVAITSALRNSTTLSPSECAPTCRCTSTASLLRYIDRTRAVYVSLGHSAVGKSVSVPLGVLIRSITFSCASTVACGSSLNASGLTSRPAAETISLPVT